MRISTPLLTGLLSCSTVRFEGHETPAAIAAEEMEGLWVLQIRRQAWKPRDLEFVLHIEVEGEGARGIGTVDPIFIGRTTARLSDFEAEGDIIRFTLHSKVDDNIYRFEGRREGGTLDGQVRWHDDKREQVEPFSAYRREVRRFDGGIDDTRFPFEDDPLDVGIEPVLLDRLVLGAETARSDSLLVVADGRLIAARTFGNEDDPGSVGSLSAAITALAGGHAEQPNGLRLRPSELAALGQALLDGGRWTGEAAVPAHWMEALAAPTTDTQLFRTGSWDLQPHPNDDTSPPIGFGHRTDAGEALLVYPEARLVVVRTLHRVENRYDGRYDDRDEMEWLDEMAETLAVEKLERLASP